MSAAMARALRARPLKTAGDLAAVERMCANPAVRALLEVRIEAGR